MFSYDPELVNKYSKYVKTIRNRTIEVEFSWFQSDPYQSYRVRLNEEQFLHAQHHIRSKKLGQVNFEQFVQLIDPIFANDAAEVSLPVIRYSFDELFDQNSNGTVEKEELESIFILLHGWFGKRKYLTDESFRSVFTASLHSMTFQEFHNAVKNGQLREFFMLKE